MITYTSLAVAPTVTTTNPAPSVGQTTATVAGNVTSSGGATVTARGIAYGTSANPIVSGSHTTESGTTGAFTSNLTSLSAGTTYHFRAYATNSQGTSYGSDVTFTTTAATTAVGPTSVTSGGSGYVYLPPPPPPLLTNPVSFSTPTILKLLLALKLYLSLPSHRPSHAGITPASGYFGPQTRAYLHNFGY